MTDPKDVVRRGYDAAASRYDEAYGSATKYGDWLRVLADRLPAASPVLDLGCGGGVPVARTFAANGHRVTGVDISEVQIARARAAVPAADFRHADVTAVDFAPASWAAVVAMYVFIHLPLADQPPLLRRVASWLRPGGILLVTTGHTAWTGTEADWLGSGAPMWWSHADAATYRGWLADAGLVVEREEFVPEGAGGHTLFVARRGGDRSRSRSA